MRKILSYPIIIIVVPFILLAYAILFLPWLIVCLWRICWGDSCDSFKSFIEDGWFL